MAGFPYLFALNFTFVLSCAVDARFQAASIRAILLL